MDSRVFWLRNQYRVVFAGGGQRQMSAEEAGRRLFGPVMSPGLGRVVLLRNGARLHLEAAGCPEYLTPGCGGVPDLVVHDKAGERIMEGLLADAGQRLWDEGIAGDIRVFKGSTDPAGDRAGCQENYQVSHRGQFGELADNLIPFLVTRQLICGAGAIARTPRGAVYCLSRRGRTGAGVPAIIGSAPLISTRDEAAAGYRQLRVTVADPTMSETTTLLRAGATDLVLRMAEAATATPELILANPVQAIGDVARDLTGRSLVRLADGRQLSALDIQRAYLARARDFTDSRGADPMTTRVLRLWQRTLDAVAAGDLDAIAREIDWVIKYQLIERYRAEHDLPLSDPEVAEADLAYHDVHRGRGLYYLLQRHGAVERAARDIDIFEAKTVPPAAVRYRRAG